MTIAVDGRLLAFNNTGCELRSRRFRKVRLLPRFCGISVAASFANRCRASGQGGTRGGLPLAASIGRRSPAATRLRRARDDSRSCCTGVRFGGGALWSDGAIQYAQLAGQRACRSRLTGRHSLPIGAIQPLCSGSGWPPRDRGWPEWLGACRPPPDLPLAAPVDTHNCQTCERRVSGIQFCDEWPVWVGNCGPLLDGTSVSFRAANLARRMTALGGRVSPGGRSADIRLASRAPLFKRLERPGRRPVDCVQIAPVRSTLRSCRALN